MRELFAFCGHPGLPSHIRRRTVATIMEPGGLSTRAGRTSPATARWNHDEPLSGQGIRSTGAAQVAGSLIF